jgi:hypothetical protein
MRHLEYSILYFSQTPWSRAQHKVRRRIFDILFMYIVSRAQWENRLILYSAGRSTKTDRWRILPLLTLCGMRRALPAPKFDLALLTVSVEWSWVNQAGSEVRTAFQYK